MLWQVNAAEPDLDRYLFLVDTSQQMAPHRDAMARFIGENIRTGFEGWAKRGEPVGLWVFNEHLTRDAVPIEFWTEAQKDRIAERAERFVALCRFEKTSQLDRIVSSMQKIVASSDALTLFILSDTQQRISGTPFDSLVNDIYRNFSHRGNTSSPAVVTRLLVRHGQFTGWSVQSLESLSRQQPLAPLQTRSSSVPIATVADLPVRNVEGANQPTNSV